MNEGHSALRGAGDDPRQMEDDGHAFGEAVRDVAAMTVFTTHTPVAAGHDRFPADAGRGAPGQDPRELAPLLRRLHGPGPRLPDRPNEPFCMTVLALKLSRARQRRQLRCTAWFPGGCGTRLYPHRTEEEVPIGHITNGVHVLTWVAPQMRAAVRPNTSAPNGPSISATPETWEGIDTIDDAELWETQQVLKARLIDFVRRRLVAQAAAPQRARRDARAVADVLDPERADHRLRPPVRDLQAGRPGPAATSSGWPKSSTTSDTPDPARLRRQGPPGRRVRQGADPADRQAHPRPAVRGPDRVRRRLRHQRRPAPGARRRRLAEQPPSPAGSQRHQRQEGGAQRRPELLDPRRLVGRGLRRHERLRHRHEARPTPPRQVQDERDHQVCWTTWSIRSSPSTTTATLPASPASGSPCKKPPCSLGWRFNADRMVVDYVDAAICRPPAVNPAPCRDPEIVEPYLRHLVAHHRSGPQNILRRGRKARKTAGGKDGSQKYLRRILLEGRWNKESVGRAKSSYPGISPEGGWNPSSDPARRSPRRPGVGQFPGEILS